MVHAGEQQTRSFLVSETFLSVQGEGKLTGVPSFFIRLSGCNLRCAWCDTPYASWKPEGDRRDVRTLIDQALASGARHAVVTGGEPLVHAGAEDLCAGLRHAGMHVTIETAGTVDSAAPCDLLSVSPKLRSSTPINDPRDPLRVWEEKHERLRLNLPALRALLSRAPERQLKFVASVPEDLAEIEAILRELSTLSPAIRPDDVLLMPEGVSAPSAEHKAWVVRACVQRGWRYCTRLHIDLFGNTRGT